MAKEVPFDFELSEPIETGRMKDNEPVTLTSIPIKRRPRGNDYGREFSFSNPSFKDFAKVCEKISNIPSTTIGKMDSRDIVPFMEMMTDFLGLD
jgi:hypothetical protein